MAEDTMADIVRIGEFGRVEFLGVFGDDLTVVNAARVSLDRRSQALSARDVGLIQFMATHGHDSPFFHPILRFCIKMPIFVAREWYRHTVGFARNEVSRRYVDSAPEAFVPGAGGVRARAAGVKQGSGPGPVDWAEEASALMASAVATAEGAYAQLIERGVAPEVARVVLPCGTYTEFIETASLSGYARLCRLRSDPSAQLEIREFAEVVARFVREVLPVSMAALEGRLGPPQRGPGALPPVMLIGVSGRLGSGKDTLADQLTDMFSFRKVRFAAGVRDAVEALTGIPAAETWSDSEKAGPVPRRAYTSEEFGEAVDRALALVTRRACGGPAFAQTFARILCEPRDSGSAEPLVLREMTVGRLLQLLGTECFREAVGPDVWVDHLFSGWRPDFPVVVSDTRFPNEAVAIRRLGGVVVRVVREGGTKADGRPLTHASEQPLDPSLVDLEIHNDREPGDLGLAIWKALPALAAIRDSRGGGQ